MAVVFISPRQRQKAFFMGITIIFLLILLVISLRVFMSKPQEIPQALVFNKPKANINFEIFDSTQFQNLQVFPEIETQYSYVGTTKSGKLVSGYVSAVSLEKAEEIVEGLELVSAVVKPAVAGRDNPFASYYQPPVMQISTQIIQR